MKPDDRLNNFFRAARQAPAPQVRELGLETRLLARLREERRGSVTLLAWKLMPWFAAVTVGAALWYWSTPQPGGLDLLAQQWEEEQLARFLN